MAAAAGWVGGKMVLAVGSINKEDFIGPVGALILAVVCLFALAGYFVKRQRMFDAREQVREDRREKQLVHIATIAESSNRAVEASAQAMAKMEQAVERFERCVSENNRILQEMKNEWRKQ